MRRAVCGAAMLAVEGVRRGPLAAGWHWAGRRGGGRVRPR